MARRPRTSPRKQPSQERSRATVDALVDATARVLVQAGYEACSTNRVAQEAGVSIGSLYQYFPNKEALVLAVLERYMGSMQAALEQRLLGLAGAPAATVAREMIRGLLETARSQRRLHKVLLEEVPRIGALRRVEELYGRYETLIAAWMEAHRDQIELEDVALAAYVLVAAVEGISNRVMVERPELLASGRLEDHIVRLVLGYLSPSRALADQSSQGTSARRSGG